MGTCCSGTRPSQKFVGEWTDNEHVQLQIKNSGRIIYNKGTACARTRMVGPARFSENEFVFSCCCCSVRGEYMEDGHYPPKLITNGTVLTRR